MELSTKRKDALLDAAMMFIGCSGTLPDFQEYLEEQREMSKLSEPEKKYWGIEDMESPDMWED